MLSCDDYLMPDSLDEALSLWSASPPGGLLVAGATDVLPRARAGRDGDVHVPSIVDISRVGELDGYEICDGRVRLGANLVYQRFLTDETLKRHLPCMPYCAVWFADDQIREQATLAGNIVNASPAADGTPPMIAMNATVKLARIEDGELRRRDLPVDEFVTGPGTTRLDPGEMVTAIECDSMLGWGGAFEKVGQRRSLVISIVCAACLVRTDDDGRRFDDVRIAVGGTGPVPVRLTAVEEYLSGKPVTSESIQGASTLGDGCVNSRTRQAYRRGVVSGFIERALSDALGDCGVRLTDATDEESIHV